MEKWQNLFDRLGVSLQVCWVPSINTARHGEVKDGKLFIYDEDLPEAEATFLHEIVEVKLKGVTEIYQTLVNSLIAGYEQLVYKRKEQFIEAVPNILELWRQTTRSNS